MTESVCSGAGLQSAPPRVAAEPLGPGLDERLMFLTAHDILVGLAPCTRERAALALLSSSEQLDLTPAELARLLLDGLEVHGDPVVAHVLDQAREDNAVLAAVAADDAAGLLLSVRPVAGHRQGLQVTGDLDDFTVPILRAATSRAVHAGTARPVVPDSGFWLDLSGLTFCDLSGLRALADLHRQVVASGADVHVLRARARGPNRLFGIAADHGWLDRAFTLHRYRDPRQPLSPDSAA